MTGRIANEKSHPGYSRLLAANFIGLFIVYAFGMVYYYVISNFVINTPIGLWPLFLYCFILAVPGDLCLCVLATVFILLFAGSSGRYRAVPSGCGNRKTNDPDDQRGETRIEYE